MNRHAYWLFFYDCAPLSTAIHHCHVYISKYILDIYGNLIDNYSHLYDNRKHQINSRERKK